MTYTIEEIEEMRKRLPFKAVVWFGDFESESVVRHIFDDGRCANNKGVWESFKEIKEPEYVPFDQETIKPFRDEWVRYRDVYYRIDCIAKHGCTIGNETATFEEFFNDITFLDTGKPFGKEVEK